MNMVIVCIYVANGNFFVKKKIIESEHYVTKVHELWYGNVDETVYWYN